MRPRMPSGRAHASVGRSCERPRRATGALAAEGGDVALVARDKTVLEAAREAVSAASERRVIAVSYDTGDQSVRDMVLAVTDGLGGVDILVGAAARRRSRWPAVRRPPRTCPTATPPPARVVPRSRFPAATSPPGRWCSSCCCGHSDAARWPPGRRSRSMSFQGPDRTWQADSGSWCSSHVRHADRTAVRFHPDPRSVGGRSE